jgi:hypothetical protein
MAAQRNFDKGGSITALAACSSALLFFVKITQIFSTWNHARKLNQQFFLYRANERVNVALRAKVLANSESNTYWQQKS